jgi:hypothetical protein
MRKFFYVWAVLSFLGLATFFVSIARAKEGPPDPTWEIWRD